MQGPDSHQLPPLHRTVLPPGSIVSTYGIRRYHTLQTPSGIVKNKPENTHHAEKESQRANTWPVHETDKQQTSQPTNREEASKQPIALPEPVTNQLTPKVRHTKELSTQTENRATAVAAFTQTDRSTQQNRKQPIAVDMATSPIMGVSQNLNSPPARVSYGNRSLNTADYQRVLSRHSDDLWNDRRSLSFVLSDDDEVGSLPTPLPTRNVGVMTKRQQPKKVHIAHQSDDIEGIFHLSKPAKATQAVFPATTYLREALPKRIVLRQQPQPPPVYVIQPTKEESDSDDEPTHYFYGPNHERLPIPPSMHGNQLQYQNSHLLPYVQQAHHQYYAPDEVGGSLRMQLRLEYGYITDGLGAKVLPDAVQEELFKEYGHIKQTEVLVVKQSGNYSIHSHTDKRKTS